MKAVNVHICLNLGPACLNPMFCPKTAVTIIFFFLFSSSQTKWQTLYTIVNISLLFKAKLNFLKGSIKSFLL